jgi:hypothetical protein
VFGTAIMTHLVQHLRRMPKALAALTGVFTGCGLIAVVMAVFPITGWYYENRPVSYGEFWNTGGGVVAVSAGAVMMLLAVGFYRAQNWVRYAVPLGLAAMTVYSLIRPDPTARYQWAGSVFWGILSYWYFFWKRAVVDYFSRGRGAEPRSS